MCLAPNADFARLRIGSANVAARAQMGRFCARVVGGQLFLIAYPLSPDAHVDNDGTRAEHSGAGD